MMIGHEMAFNEIEFNIHHECVVRKMSEGSTSFPYFHNESI